MMIWNDNKLLFSFGKVWYIESSSNRTLASITVSSHCPVEMRININGLTLESANKTGTISNNYVDMEAVGVGTERNVTATVLGKHMMANSLEIELFGTNEGRMTLIVEQEFTDGTTETQVFNNVPVTGTILGNAKVRSQSTVILTLKDTETGSQEFWVANANETVSEAISNSDFEVVPDSISSPSSTTTAGRKIMCKRYSTKSRMALKKQCRWRPEALVYPWPSLVRRYARLRRECRCTSGGKLTQWVSRQHGPRT